MANACGQVYLGGLFVSDAMTCRMGCGACCIAPSISSPIPGMPEGKPAGVPCVQLTEDNLCALFGQPERPDVCQAFSAERSVCGDHREEALRIIATLEQDSATIHSE